MNKKKLVEWGKNLLIAALIVSAGLLAVESGYYTSLRESFAFSGGEESRGASTGDKNEFSHSPTAKPVAVAICGSDGKKYGISYDGDAVNSLFQRFSASLGEAMGSAGEPAETDAAGFRRALSGQGVFLKLPAPQSLGLLSGWLGTKMTSSAAGDTAGLLFLSTAGDTARLYYKNTDERFFACDTAVASADVVKKLGEVQPNGAYFAFEKPSLSGLDAYTLMLDVLPEVEKMTVSSVLLDSADTVRLLEALDINKYVVLPYTESDGTTVYVDGGNTLRIAPAGRVQYRSEDGLPGPVGLDADSAVNFAMQLAQSCLGGYCGRAQLYFSGLTVPGHGTYSVSADYIIDGVPVRLKSGHAVQAIISGGSLKSIEFQFRRYEGGGEIALIPPMLMAAAIVSSGDGGTLDLAYIDGGETLECVWVTD